MNLAVAHPDLALIRNAGGSPSSRMQRRQQLPTRRSDRFGRRPATADKQKDQPNHTHVTAKHFPSSGASPGRRASFPVAMRALLLFLLSASLTLAAAPRPNIVFILADDLGWADVGFHGGRAPTPHLDRLAREGLELSRHYVAPVCTPTRAGLLTGRYWSRFGVTSPQNERALPPDTVTLPRALGMAGYATCLTGKWHLGSEPAAGPNTYGFDHSYGSLAGGVGPWDHFYKQGPYTVTWHRNGKLLTETGHVTDLITEEAVRWINARDERPFFLYVPYTAVHLPVKEPQVWLDRVPAVITGEVDRHYAACIMHLDDAVGRLIQALERTGKRDNTLLVFTSDNGGSTSENNDRKYPADAYPPGSLPGDNRPWRGKKGDLYEGGIRVPTVLSWPGVLTTGKFEEPMHISDWMPTLCALAGWSPDRDPKWDGHNLWPALSGTATAPRRPLYWVAPGFRARAVQDDGWKLIHSSARPQEKVELFHLSEDPQETRDLASKQPDRVAALRATLERLAERDRDAVPAKP